MLGLNIFRLIGDLFSMLLKPFEWIRLTLAKGDAGWWTSNAVNWLFLLVLILLLGYWMGQALKFKREGTEDRA
ncbi:hypothetical protein SAMN04489761_3173 [Tenacibaculum sp. MAR_2009_124]|uniref:DUF6341 family protein n=1 Tax=Tenacibaculum sp. MAR_2009_124 TaxID=1250059 RepID=UPI00089A7023|nr:hypothetical protein [Tenacibaculum sp. MAR_2009_124]SEC50412.1 hypothetical protein SAMN04489761_3173 [Tenacibaculum sp. MAR_2009_124]